MKHKSVRVIIVVLVAMLVLSVSNDLKNKNSLGLISTQVSDQEQIISQLSQELETIYNKIQDIGDGLTAHGALWVDGHQLKDQNKSPFQLKGFSSHGLCWYPEYVNYNALRTTKDYGANVFRIAVYTEKYIENPEPTLKVLYSGMENAIAADMYVIVDWHILKDNNPNIYKEEALIFFKNISEQFGNHPSVIYEICNEPNGDTSWEDITGYANEVIPAIRENAKDALIIVGTPKYSTDLEGPLNSPLQYKNIMYAYHQYIGTTDGYSKEVIKSAMKKGLPVFVSEWGISNSYEGLDKFEQARKMVKGFNEIGVSWISWSLSNKDESSAAIKPDNIRLEGWAYEDFSRSGKITIDALK